MMRMLIVDDHHLYVSALERELKQLRPQALCHRASNLQAALKLLSEPAKYDIVFLDLRLPDSQGVDAVATVLKAAPDTRVAVISGYDDPRLMRDAYDRGAVGFLQKGAELEAFRNGLTSLLSGGFYFTAEALASKPPRDDVATLTRRERQVLDELILGQSTKVIARKLGLAPTTVDKHIDQIRSKVGSNTRLELVARIRELRRSAELL
jgi:DNA-binding NarL/FixJ family response regulator